MPRLPTHHPTTSPLPLQHVSPRKHSSQVDDEQAATLAARVLSSNKGNVDAAIQQLLLTAVSRSKVGTQTMPPSAAAPPRQQQQQQQQQLQLQLHTQRQGQGQEGIVLGQGLEQGLRLGLGQGLGLRVGQAQGQPQGQYSLAPLQRRELYAGNAGNGTGDRSGGGGGGGFQRLETQALFAPQLRPLALARTASGGSGSFLVRQDSQGQLLVMQQMPAVQPQLVSYNQAGMGVGGGSGLGQGFGLDLSQPNFARGGAPISFGASSVPTLSASQLSADRVSSAAGGGGLRRQPSVVQALQRQSSLTGVQVHDVFGGQGAGLNALVSMPTAVRLVPIGQQGLGPLAAQLRHQQQQRQLQQFQY